MVVMENLAPARLRDAQLETSKIQYLGNSSDYFRDTRVPQIAESDFRDIPVALLGARQAINLARFAGAERDASKRIARCSGRSRTGRISPSYAST